MSCPCTVDCISYRMQLDFTQNNSLATSTNSPETEIYSVLAFNSSWQVFVSWKQFDFERIAYFVGQLALRTLLPIWNSGSRCWYSKEVAATTDSLCFWLQFSVLTGLGWTSSLRPVRHNLCKASAVHYSAWLQQFKWEMLIRSSRALFFIDSSTV